MKRQAIVGCIIAVCLVLGIGVNTASGQAVFGSIIGSVTDAQGNAVAGAKVTVTSTTKSFAYDTTTNESGNYSVTHLIPDTYKVHIEAAGFQITEIPSVVLNADAAATVNVQLVGRSGDANGRSHGRSPSTPDRPRGRGRSVQPEVRRRSADPQPQLHQLRIALAGHAEIAGFQPRCHGESSGRRTNPGQWAALLRVRTLS